VASLLWSYWYHERLLLGVGVDLSGVGRWKACSWGSDRDLLLSSHNSGGVGVFSLLTLRICLSILRWYICRDDQDLAIWGLEFFSRIIRGDCCVSDLEREAVWRRFLVQPAAMSRGKRSSKLLENTALACGVLGVFVDRAGLIEVIPAASTILMTESRFDLDLALHVA
jgi:hypothetical protein